MRLFVLGMVVACLAVTVSAGAQTVGIDLFGGSQSTVSTTASWYGSTGLIVTPSAYIAPLLRVNGGYHQVQLDDYDQDLYSANVAVLSDLEVGISRVNNVVKPDTEGTVNETVFNAKYRLPLGQWLGVGSVAPQVAVGVWDLSDQVNRDYYLVVSQSFGLSRSLPYTNVAAHVGYGQRELAGGSLDGLFAGFEFTPTQSTLLQVEYDADAWNAALRYQPIEWATVDVGVLDGEFGYGLSAVTAF